jgi:MFS family permease
MLSQKNRIYISTFINTLGNWLTFLAIALITKEKYGASQVALVFLVQTLPAIIFSQSLSRLIPIGKIEKYYWAIQVLLAACSLLMVASQSLFMIYTFLIITSLLKSISNPLFNSLIGKWINKDDHKHVFTLTLFVFAPAPVAIISAFLIAGVFSSYLAGSLLAAIQGSVPTGYNPLPVWAYANQMTQVINLIAYGSAGCLLNIIGYQTFGGIMVGLLILMILRSSNFSKNTIHRDLDLYG